MIAITGTWPEDFGYKIVSDPFVGSRYEALTAQELIHHQAAGKDLDRLIAKAEETEPTVRTATGE